MNPAPHGKFPPHLSMDAYVKWIESNLANLPNPEAAWRQKALEEPGTLSRFCFPDDAVAAAKPTRPS